LSFSGHAPAPQCPSCSEGLKTRRITDLLLNQTNQSLQYCLFDSGKSDGVISVIPVPNVYNLGALPAAAFLLSWLLKEVARKAA